MINPFTPTFGIVPPYLAGRSVLLNEMNRALDNWPGDPNLSTILIGPRGSGKTALLSSIGDIAMEKGWIVADTSATDGMLEDILQRIIDVTENLIDHDNGRKLTGVNIGAFGISWDNADITPANWRSRMSKILKQLNSNGIGLMITIDEVRADVEAMIQFASVYQLLVRDGAKIALVMAGLPVNVSNLISNKSVSFLRRSRQQYLNRIADSDVRSAFQMTIRSAGKTICEDALAAAVTASSGFAYMMQLVGYQIWNASGSNETIVLENALEGIRYAEEDFNNGVLKSTCNELSEGDMKILFAMLDDKESSSMTDLSGRLNKSAGYVYTYKKRLLQAGVVEETHRSRITFAIPLLREYLTALKESE